MANLYTSVLENGDYYLVAIPLKIGMQSDCCISLDWQSTLRIVNGRFIDGSILVSHLRDFTVPHTLHRMVQWNIE